LIKNTAYWNVDFNNGVGLVPTFLVTTGVIGFLSVLFFVFMFAVRSFKYLRFAFKNTTSNYFLISSFILSLYGWVSLFVYTPGVVIVTLTFLATGVFIGALVNQKMIPVYNLSFLNDSLMNSYNQSLNKIEVIAAKEEEITQRYLKNLSKYEKSVSKQ
jgi:hypothetical protein